MHDANERLTGIVLAGGASRRMGCDKAELVVNGRRLLDHAVLQLRAAGARSVVISGQRTGYDSVGDVVADQGPLGGIDSVIAARPGLEGNLLLIVPVDTPALDAAALKRLVAATRGGPGAIYSGSPLPMAVRATEGLRRGLQHLLTPGEKAAVGRLAEALGLRAIPPTGVDLTNLNYPADLAHVIAAQGSSGPGQERRLA